MSRLSELIAELCPDGVEYKALGDLGAFYGGLTGKTKKDFGDGAKFVTYNNVYGNPAVDLEEYGLVNVGPDERQNTVELGDVLFTISSENREEAGLTSVMTVDPGEPWYLNSFCTGWRLHDKSISLPDFLKHVLRGPEVREAISRTANGVTRFNISKPRLAKVRVPVPPIEVQREVVRILDEYTAAHDELIGHLEEEMSLRRSVLEDVRDSLMLGDSSVLMLPFREYCVSMNTGPFGSSVHKADYVNDGCPIVNPADIKGTEVTVGKMVSTEAEQRLTRYKLQVNDLVIGRRGEMGRVGIIDETTAGFLCGTGCFFVRMNDLVLPQYWKHFFSTSYAKTYLEAHAVGSTMKNLNLDILGGMPVPIPDLDRQAHIIDVLNGLSSSNIEMVGCLLSEIEYQNKCLDHVRNQLLSFPEKVA